MDEVTIVDADRWVGSGRVQDTRVALMMPTAMKEAIEAVAKRRKVSISRWCRGALVAGLEAEHAERAAGLMGDCSAPAGCSVERGVKDYCGYCGRDRRPRVVYRYQFLDGDAYIGITVDMTNRRSAHRNADTAVGRKIREGVLHFVEQLGVVPGKLRAERVEADLIRSDRSGRLLNIRCDDRKSVRRMEMV